MGEKDLVHLLLMASEGIAGANRFLFLDILPGELRRLDFRVVAPWTLRRPEQPFGLGPGRGNAWYDCWLHFSFAVASGNQQMIDGCDAVIPILDAKDMDSATAAALGFAHGRGKPIFALAPDFDHHLDREVCPIDMSAEWMVHASGGSVSRTIEELIQCLHSWRCTPSEKSLDNITSLFNPTLAS